jgi:hypothetical protein
VLGLRLLLEEPPAPVAVMGWTLWAILTAIAARQLVAQ